MSFERIELSLDNQNNLAYISEPYDWSKKEITIEVEKLIYIESTIELCLRNFLDYVVMSQENLFYLFFKWEEMYSKKNIFILIYEDDKNWYDSQAFQSKEAMEQFISDHTKK